MEPLRDWFIQIGWTQQSAAAASIAVAIFVAYLVGWCLRLLVRAPRHRFLKSSEAWREAMKMEHTPDGFPVSTGVARRDPSW